MSLASPRPRSPRPPEAIRGGSQELLRRLLIRCPATGLATDTGFELTSISTASRSPQMLIDCLSCGQDHSWAIADAFLDAGHDDGFTDAAAGEEWPGSWGAARLGIP